MEFDVLRDIWPCTPAQLDAIAAVHRYQYTLFGGKAGPGKTFTLLACGTYLAHLYAAYGHRDCHVVVASRDKERVVERFGELLRKYVIRPGHGVLVGGTKEAPARVEFRRSGAIPMWLCGLHDVSKLRGSAAVAILIDELTEYEEIEFHDVYWRARYAGGDKVNPLRHQPIFATSNPDGPGSYWVYQYFVSRDFATPYGENIQKDRDLFHFIPADLEDNPDKEFVAQYKAVLARQPEHLRRAREQGIWDFGAGARFPYPHKLLASFDAPPDWERATGLDYGRVDPTVMVEAAFDPLTGDCYVLWSQDWTGLSLPSFGSVTRDMLTPGVRYIAHGADPTLWIKEPKAVRTMASYFQEKGYPITRSTNKHGVPNNLIEKYLEPDNGYPNLYFVEGTTQKLRMDLQAVRFKPDEDDEAKKENLAPHVHTHSVYALGYLLERAWPQLKRARELTQRERRAARLLKKVLPKADFPKRIHLGSP